MIIVCFKSVKKTKTKNPKTLQEWLSFSPGSLLGSTYLLTARVTVTHQWIDEDKAVNPKLHGFILLLEINQNSFKT